MNALGVLIRLDVIYTKVTDHYLSHFHRCRIALNRLRHVISKIITIAEKLTDGL